MRLKRCTGMLPTTRPKNGGLGGARRATGAGGKAPREALTPRQRETIQLLAEGKSNKEVAVMLGISIKTVEAHRSNIMLKLNLHSVAELVHYAIRNDIVHSPESGDPAERRWQRFFTARPDPPAAGNAKASGHSAQNDEACVFEGSGVRVALLLY